MTRDEVIRELEAWLLEDPEAYFEHEVTGHILTVADLISQVREARGLGEELYQKLLADPDFKPN